MDRHRELCAKRTCEGKTTRNTERSADIQHEGDKRPERHTLGIVRQKERAWLMEFDYVSLGPRFQMVLASNTESANLAKGTNTNPWHGLELLLPQLERFHIIVHNRLAFVALQVKVPAQTVQFRCNTNNTISRFESPRLPISLVTVIFAAFLSEKTRSAALQLVVAEAARANIRTQRINHLQLHEIGANAKQSE